MTLTMRQTCNVVGDWNRLVEEIDTAVEQEAKKIEARMLDRATKRFVAAGYPPAEAYDLAVKALYASSVPSTFVLPSFDDL